MDRNSGRGKGEICLLSGDYPDIVIGCFGGGSNFGGISFPFLRHNFSGERKTRFIAAESVSCPKLTQGRFEYDFGDEAGCLFAKAEGIIPAPESCHAIAATIREAIKCNETGEEKVILFCLSGHGLIDMNAYDQYLAGNIQ